MMDDYVEVPLGDLNGVGSVVMFTVFKKKRRLTAFALRHDEGIAVYVNSCPHFSSPLTDTENPLDAEGRPTCAVHGAKFDAKSGACISGPCPGQSLTSIDHEVVGDFLRIPTQLARPRPAR